MNDDLSEFDIQITSRLVAIVYDVALEELRIENPDNLPFHEVLGLLHLAVMRWESEGYDYDE